MYVYVYVCVCVYVYMYMCVCNIQQSALYGVLMMHSTQLDHSFQFFISLSLFITLIRSYHKKVLECLSYAYLNIF